jgi:hypothetical protein
VELMPERVIGVADRNEVGEIWSARTGIHVELLDQATGDLICCGYETSSRRFVDRVEVSRPQRDTAPSPRGQSRLRSDRRALKLM